MCGGINHFYSIVREPTTPRHIGSQEQQNEQAQQSERERHNMRDAQTSGSPENRCTPAPPPQGIIFQGQQYNNLPDHIVAGLQRIMTQEQAIGRAGGSSQVGHHQ